MGVRNSLFFTASVLNNYIGMTLYEYYLYYQLGVRRFWSQGIQLLQCVPQIYKHYYSTIGLK